MIKRVLLTFSLILVSNCAKEESHFSVKGTILQIIPDKRSLRIAHDTIPKLMMPMEMNFFVPDSNEYKNFKVGDSVHFDFVWDLEEGPYALNFKKVGLGYIPKVDDWFFNDEEYSERVIGDTLDNVTLLNLDSLDINLISFGKEYYFISFIFSRCPMPNMCPAIVLKNKALINGLSDQKDIHFLLISFDYMYDSPKLLKNYYNSLISNYDNIDVLSSYGKIEDIYKLGKQSGCEFWGIEKGKIGHTMQSIFINKDLKILGKWSGEDWKAEMTENSVRYIINN